MILDIIQKSKETQILIGFNFYGGDSGFYCGYVLNYTEDFMIIQHFSRFGVNDGILVHKIADVKYFETDTEYLKGLKRIISSQNAVRQQTYFPSRNAGATESFTHLFESFIGNREYLLKFELADGDVYFGFVEWCDEESFSIVNIDTDGVINGKAIFRFEDLKLYWIDDLECRRRKVFYEMKNGNG